MLLLISLVCIVCILLYILLITSNTKKMNTISHIATIYHRCWSQYSAFNVRVLTVEDCILEYLQLIARQVQICPVTTLSFQPSTCTTQHMHEPNNAWVTEQTLKTGYSEGTQTSLYQSDILQEARHPCSKPSVLNRLPQYNLQMKVFQQTIITNNYSICWLRNKRNTKLLL